MKTNRRGFFTALAGLAGGVVAAFQTEAKADVKLVDVTTMADKPKVVIIESKRCTSYGHIEGDWFVLDAIVYSKESNSKTVMKWTGKKANENRP